MAEIEKVVPPCKSSTASGSADSCDPRPLTGGRLGKTEALQIWGQRWLVFVWISLSYAEGLLILG